MRALLLLPLLSALSAAQADEPAEAATAEVIEVTTPSPSPPPRFVVSLKPTPPPCVGPLVPGAAPCRYVATLGTLAAYTVAEILRPVDARLVRASSVSPRGVGLPVLRSGAPTAPGLLFSGYSSNPLFPGLGEFDMRARGGP
jgi:hypothetical protein